VTYAGACPEGNGRDNDSRPTGITQGTAGVSFAYDAAGRRASLTLPDGVVVNYGYDAASELTGLSYTSGGAVLGNLTYAYDSDGRRVQMGGTLARTGMPSPTTSTAACNADNELTSWDGTTLAYDNNGNMTSDGVDTYSWDQRNQLSSISGLYSASFEYDPFGRRQAKTINSATTGFLYDGVNPVQELSGTTVTANLLTGLGVDEYFTRTDSTGTSNFLTDALGSTIALADTTGTVQTQYTYDPFGGTTTQGAANASSYQFTGRENDGQGLYYYRARYYNPVLSRFVSEDPFDYAGGQADLFGYVGDDPTHFADPGGHEFIAAIVLGVGAGAGALNEGMQAYNCGARGVRLAEAIGRGMAAGAAGAMTGLLVEPFDAFAAGAAGGAAYTAVNSWLQTGHVDWSQVPLNAAIGGSAGAFAEDWIPNGPGRSVNTWESPRTFGPKAIQHYARDIVGAGVGTGLGAAVNQMAGTNCGCH
jgi:RHS repeat-associated protein